MNDKVFLDTNVLVYAFDSADSAKQKRSLRILEREYLDPPPVISTQVLQEFYVVVSRKLEKPLSEEDAERVCIHLSKFPCVVIDPQMVLDAIRLNRAHELSLWDALIVRAAIKSGCQTLLTEDLQHGIEIEDLRVVNPYEE